jgi:glycine cleavage system H lipoate-binding protein
MTEEPAAQGSDGARRFLKCVWMEAGAVSYRLCDRDLDCEHCPLDQALRSQARGPAQGQESPAFVTEMGLRFPTDRFYTPHHQWVRIEAPDRVRVGLDALATSLFPGLRQVWLPRRGARVVRNGRCWALTYRAGLIRMPSPLSGRVQEANRTLLRDPRRLQEDPYGSGWLFVLNPSRLAEDLQGTVFGGEVLRWVRRDLHRGLQMVQDFRAARAPGGPLLADGGAWDGEGLRTLSRRQHRAVVSQLLRWRVAPRAHRSGRR